MNELQGVKRQTGQIFLVGQGVSAQIASDFTQRVSFYFKELRDLAEVMDELPVSYPEQGESEASR